jgi:hypothetical protein
MNEIKDKDLDSFIFSSTYERYKRNILKDREDKTLGQWSFDEEKINNLKYAYVYLKDSGGLIVKKYTIEKLFKSGFDKDFNDPNKFVFIFSESIDFFAQYPETEIVQGRLYGNSVKLDNLTKLNESEVDARINKSRYINSSEGKKKPKTSAINDPVLNELRKLWKEKFPDENSPKVEIVKQMVKRHKEGESLVNIINSYNPK